MNDDIQAARDTLARWGERATPGPWTRSLNELRARSPWNGFLLGTWANRDADARLIVAMTDPALREALDGMLSASAWHSRFSPGPSSAFIEHAERIAAVILDINKRVGA